MADISFNENPEFVPRATQQTQPLFTRLLIKAGFVKDHQSAQILLIGVIVAAVIATAFFLPIWKAPPEPNIPVASPK